MRMLWLVLAMLVLEMGVLVGGGFSIFSHGRTMGHGHRMIVLHTRSRVVQVGAGTMARTRKSVLGRSRHIYGLLVQVLVARSGLIGLIEAKMRDRLLLACSTNGSHPITTILTPTTNQTQRRNPVSFLVQRIHHDKLEFLIVIRWLWGPISTLNAYNVSTMFTDRSQQCRNMYVYAQFQRAVCSVVGCWCPDGLAPLVRKRLGRLNIRPGGVPKKGRNVNFPGGSFSQLHCRKLIRSRQ